MYSLRNPLLRAAFAEVAGGRRIRTMRNAGRAVRSTLTSVQTVDRFHTANIVGTVAIFTIAALSANGTALAQVENRDALVTVGNTAIVAPVTPPAKADTAASNGADIRLASATYDSDSYTVGTRMRVPMTAYSSTVDQTDSTPFITASGTHVHWGTVAANFLPFGTKIKIPEMYGDQIFIVEDRMNKRYWHKVDIWMPTRQDALNFGIRTLEIEILEEV